MTGTVHSHCRRVTVAVAASVLGGWLFAPPAARAIEDIPTWKTLVFPVYCPKNGQNSMGAGNSVGEMRNAMETTYEGWWKETSYYQSNPTNGARIRGWFVDSKTYGEIAMQWAYGNQGNISVMTNVIVGMTMPNQLTYSGTLGNVPADGISPAGGVTISMGPIILQDPRGSGVLSGHGQGSFFYATGDYDFTLSQNPGQVEIIVSYATWVSSNGMTSPANWINLTPSPALDHDFPDGRGEFNMERNDDGTPQQRYGGTGALLDGYWTPGERFEDVRGDSTNAAGSGDNPPDGRWSDTLTIPEVTNENRWVANPVAGASGIAVSLRKTVNPWDKYRGEFYADYENSTAVNADTTVVMAVAFKTNYTLYIADIIRGTNLTVNVSGLNVTPPRYFQNGVPVMPAGASTNWLLSGSGEGDMTHTVVTGQYSATPLIDFVNISSNKMFDYNYTATNIETLVYPARGNGVAGSGTGLVYVSYFSYVMDPTRLTNNIFTLKPPVFGGDPGPDQMLPPPYTDSNSVIGNINIPRIEVRTPVYQAGELWGRFLQVGTDPHTNERWYVDSFVDDSQYTPGRERVTIRQERFDDYISWWLPFGGEDEKGAWLSGVIGLPGTNYSAGLYYTAMGEAVSNFSAVSWATYQQYINDNYPGNAAALIARAGNNVYDGPDDWQDVANNKMIIRGYVLDSGGTTRRCAMAGTASWWTYGGTAGWDPYGECGGTFDGWWTSTINHGFGQYSVAAPTWPERFFDVEAWPKVPQPASTPIVTTNIVVIDGVPVSVTTTNWPAVVYPPAGSTWGYDGPREFADLPSSMYHSSGDLRLGEETSPYSFRLDGALSAQNPFPPVDQVIPTAGPLAYNIHGTHAEDAGSLINLECLTWRTDGTSLTGPRNAVSGYGTEMAITYAEDHRDLNLDGLVDQGETVPERCYNYFNDHNRVTVNNGQDTQYPFNHQRYMEDCIEQTDQIEDFDAVNKNSSAATADVVLQTPYGFTWTNNTAMSNYPGSLIGGYLPNVRTRMNGPAHTVFNAITDDMWVDVNGSGAYDAEQLLNSVAGSLTNATAGADLPFVKYLDLDRDGGFSLGADFAWYDANNNNRFDTEVVLGDSGSLTNGKSGNLVTFVESYVRVYYQDADGVAGASDGDNYWLEGRTTNSVINGLYDVTNDLVIYVGSNGSFTNTAVGVNITAQIRYQHVGLGADAGLQPGDDDIWVDSTANGRYDGEEGVHVPRGLAFKDTMMAVTYTTNSLGNVAYSGGGAYAWSVNPVWIDSVNDNNYNADTVILNNSDMANGTVGALNTRVAWIPRPDTNGVVHLDRYTPLYPVTIPTGEGEVTVYLGDALWIDGNSSRTYDEANVSVYPLYLFSFINPNGTAQYGGPKHSGTTAVGMRTRDFGATVSTYDQVWPVFQLAGITHEQCHDICSWPDLYDYDRYSGEYYNRPIGTFDLMGEGGMVHGYPDLKWLYATRWITPQELTTTLVDPNTGVKTLFLYPVEHVPDQYYIWRNPERPDNEYFWFHYQSGSSPYSSLGQGIYIEHTDNSLNPNARPEEQSINNRFTYRVVQADGRYDMEDGLDSGTADDLWGITNKTFTEGSTPAAKWFNQKEANIRIVDMRLPTNSWDPAEIDIEWVTTTNEWYWTAGGGDSNSNGVPDAWEQYWFKEYANPLAIVTTNSDWDGDDLIDIAEWKAHLNPKIAFSWNMGQTVLTDGDADLDGDGLSNLMEYRNGSDMRNPDTDDDGLSDGEESRGLRGIFSSPLYSRDPLIERGLKVAAANTLTLPSWEVNDYTRFMSSNWTLEVWIKPLGVETGTILSRTTLQGGTNFVLGLTNNVPYVGFTTEAFTSMRVSGPLALASNTWTHLAGVFNTVQNSLQLFVNGVVVSSASTFNEPAQGHASLVGGRTTTGTAYLGGGFNGYIDEVRIWGSARSNGQVRAAYDKIINTPWVPGVIQVNGSNQVVQLVDSIGNDGTLFCNLRFDDGQNETHTNLIGGIVEKHGAEDFVHPTNWYYSVNVGTAQFVTNAGQFVPMKLSNTQPSPLDNLDEDGLPSAWQLFYWPDSQAGGDGPWSPTADPDGDGVDNIHEYLLGLNPIDADSDRNGISDGEEDADGDGVSNSDEGNLWKTNPADPDTDDDGVSDGEELNPQILKADGRKVTGPLDSQSPLVPRSLVLNGTALSVPSPVDVAGADTLDLGSWTLETWVKLDGSNETGNLIVRRIGGNGQTNFALRVDHNIPSVVFTTALGVEQKVSGTVPLPSNTWFHVAGVFDDESDALTLYLNGLSYSAQRVLNSPARGAGQVYIGEGVKGYMDELRIWTVVRSDLDIFSFYKVTLKFKSKEVSKAFTVSSSGDTNTLWQALFTGIMPPGITGFSTSFSGSPQAAGTYSGFPIMPNEMATPSDGIVLSAGSVQSIGSSNNAAGTGTDLNTAGYSNAPASLTGGNATHDAVIFEIKFTSDSSVEGISFDLLFGSEEFPEYVGEFNDAFLADLDGNNIAFDSNGNPLTVNNNFFELDNDPWHPDDPDKVGKTPVTMAFEFDGLTPLLSANKKLTPGAHTLRFVVFDTRDGILDSAIFLSNFKFSMGGKEGLSKVSAVGDIGAYYPFDDGQNMVNTNAIDGILRQYGAEHFAHRLDWSYAITGTVFSTLTYADLHVFLEDSDADGIPDWWGDVFLSSGQTATDDSDRDGLNNLYEYYVDTNPHSDDSDADGKWDSQEDSDVDALSNVGEQTAGSRPDLVDTDDDGVTDSAEVTAGTDPVNSFSPEVDRVLSVNGAGYVEMPTDSRFGLAKWTLEAWVKPATLTNTAVILGREVQTNAWNYALNIDASGRVIGRFTPGELTADVTVTSTVSLATGVWTHVAASFDSETGYLTVYVNGAARGQVSTVKSPVKTGVGPLWTRAGQGFNGLMDEAAIYGYNLSTAQVRETKEQGILMATNVGASVCYYRFDDGTHTNGTSGNTNWHRGQVQESAAGIGRDDWNTGWQNAGTLVNGATMITAPADLPAPLRYGLMDPESDMDGDGLSNDDELSLGTNIRALDTDDDGYSDFVEVNNMTPDPADGYGMYRTTSGPKESLSPRIRRSLIMGGRNLELPYGDRFGYLPSTNIVAAGPGVTITAPTDGENVAVRFTTLTGSVTSGVAMSWVRIYNNNSFVAEVPLNSPTATAFNQQIIIRAGANVIRVEARDTEGQSGSASVTVNGAFAPADIRVTQTWSAPGDLDTWLVDPQGRHRGWTASGPGLPNNVAAQIPGSMLDIDDIPGVGPENVTVERGNAVAGNYEVWMNNYANSANAQSTVRVLVNEGQTNEQFVEFGPQAMPTSDANGSTEAAWWHVTTISWPSGRMSPAGTPVQSSTPVEPGTGGEALKGWTVEAWVMPMDNSQSGAIGAYFDLRTNLEWYIVGMTNNRPFIRMRTGGNVWYEASAAAIPSNQWTHLAFVYAETERSLRVHVNGSLMMSQQMLEEMVHVPGRFVFDTSYIRPDGLVTNRFTSLYLDEFRVWSLDRGAQLIAENMYEMVPVSPNLVAFYPFDDGGLGMEDFTHRLDWSYSLENLPDAVTNEKPGGDGIWGTVDDVAAGPGTDGQNDYTTARFYSPTYGDPDSDLDGLPDWWENLFFGGVAKPTDDPDGDGLNNLYEYLSGTNPKSRDSNNNGVLDVHEDLDRDGVPNITEQQNNSDTRLADTDDDGVPDYAEGLNGTSATNSLSPAVDRVLRVTGGGYVDMPSAMRFGLSDWTVEAWIKPNTLAAGTIIARQLQANVWNYSLSLNASGRVIAMFTPGDLSANMTVTSSVSVAAGSWSHVAASLQEFGTNTLLSVYVDGILRGSRYVTKPSTINGLGPMWTRVGEGLDAWMDDVAIYGGALSESQVKETKEMGVLMATEAGAPISYYRFDDGTNGVGTSGNPNWRRGQVQDFAPGIRLDDWNTEWQNAGTLAAGASVVTAPSDLPAQIRYSLLDPGSDMDSDGLSNADEIEMGTSIRDADTDDDGVEDKAEVDQSSNPLDSISPLVLRYIRNDGAGFIGIPKAAGDDALGGRFGLSQWTLDATIRLTAIPTAEVSIIRRAVLPNGYLNYELGVSTSLVPFARYQTDLGTNCRVNASSAIQTNRWVSLTGRFGTMTAQGHPELSIFIDAEKKGQAISDKLSVSGEQQGDVIVASNLVGEITEVRIWNVARSDEDIVNAHGKVLLFGEEESSRGGLELSGGYLQRSLNTYTSSLSEDVEISTWTIEAWVKATGPGDIVKRHAGIAENGDELWNYRVSLTAQGQVEAMFDALIPVGGGLGNVQWGGVYVPLSGSSLFDGQWHHIAFSFNQRIAVVYVDGRVTRTVEYPLNSVAAVRWHGDPPAVMSLDGWTVATDGGDFMIGEGVAGLVDEVRVFSVGSSTYEIVGRMWEKVLPGTRNLLVYYDFDNLNDDQMQIIPDKANTNAVCDVKGGAKVVPGGAVSAPVTASAVELLAGSLAGYFPMLDGRYPPRNGRESVEDFLYPLDFEYAGSLFPSTNNIDFVTIYSGATNANSLYPVFNTLTNDSPWRTDSDGDGMSDLYEQYYHLQPTKGQSDQFPLLGPYGDVDGDGLNNLVEYNAGLSPLNPDSDGDGIWDYDDRSSATNRTYGEEYTDRDWMDDTWELRYPTACSPLLFDADVDPDHDGWSNFGEFMAGTDPGTGTNYPIPGVTLTVRYDGVSSGPLVLHAFNNPQMDGVPSVVYRVPNVPGSTYPGQTSFFNLTNNLVSGYLTEGSNWFYAFMDLNGNNAADENEPAGVISPAGVGWGEVPLEVGLSARLNGYGLFAWAPNGNDRQITIRQVNASNQPVMVTNRLVRFSRSYFQPNDYWANGYYGLPNSGALTPVYEWLVDNVSGGYFTNRWTLTNSAPVPQSPVGGFWPFGQVELVWKADTTNTQFEIDLRPDSSAGATLYGSTIVTPSPWRDANGLFRYILPYYAGDGQFTNRVYFWSVRALSPVSTGTWSSAVYGWSAFTLDVRERASEADTITGTIEYYDRVLTNASYNIMVQAFKSSGFSGIPSAQITLNETWTSPTYVPFTIHGLPVGSYAVRAFIDQNGNKQLDSFESYGFFKDTVTPYSTLYKSSYMPDGGRIIIRDRDADNDRLPDGWEYRYAGNLTTRGAGYLYGSPAYTDVDGDELNDYDEYILGTDPNAGDSDGDGISDGREFAMGLNPRSVYTGSSGIPDVMRLAAGTADGSNTNDEEVISIKHIGFDSGGNPVIEWNTYSNRAAISLRYVLESSPDLMTWTPVGSILAPGTRNGNESLTAPSSTNRNLFYRLRFRIE